MTPIHRLVEYLGRVSLLQWQVAVLVLLAGVGPLTRGRSPGPPPADLVAEVDTSAVALETAPAQDWGLLLRVIGQRQLFRPPLPTATAESAAMTARKMLQNLSLVGIVTEGGGAKAWIAEKGGGLALYREGDHVGGFTVGRIDSEVVELEVSGQVVELRR